MPSTDDLWGGRLEEILLDPVTHTCVMRINVNVGGVRSRYQLVLHKVDEFRFHTAIPEPWTYAEVTEVHAHYDDGAPGCDVEIVLWSEDAGIVVRCQSVAVDEVNDDGHAPLTAAEGLASDRPSRSN